MKHEIKIKPKYFEQVLSGNKTFETRINDRGYNDGDIVVLKEWDINYTGRTFTAKIGYCLYLKEYFGNDNQYVVFSLLDISQPPGKKELLKESLEDLKKFADQLFMGEDYEMRSAGSSMIESLQIVEEYMEKWLP